MRKQFPRDNKWLLLPAFLYGLGVCLRNYLYNSKILSSRSYPIPIICVGNLAVGGTGKTPHVEYLLHLLSRRYKVAVISRGYKRATRGMQVATVDSTARQIGDEPCQIKQKFPHITVIVDGNRNRAIEYLCNQNKENRPDVILMDDGFQHRSVQPMYSILLATYGEDMWTEKLLPAGRLREPITSRHRADMIIVTKCPYQMRPIDETILRRKMELYPHQKILFSHVSYGCLQPVFPQDGEILEPIPMNTDIVAFAGIACPDAFFDHLQKSHNIVARFSYRDHYNFSEKDAQEWLDLYEKWSHQQTKGAALRIVCTEKDAVKIRSLSYLASSPFSSLFYYLPISISFRANGANVLEQEVISCIEHNGKG